jgi:proteic killer suppression protein
MIRSFRDKRSQQIWGGLRVRGLSVEFQIVALRKLRVLNRGESLDELKVPPSNRLEALEHDRKGQHSIRINVQWRICFFWRGGGAHDVEIVDYH